MCNLYHRSTAAPLLSSTACVVVPWWYTAWAGIPAGPAVDGVYGVRGRTNERINVPRYRGIRRPTVGNASAHAGANPQGGQARHLGTGAVQAGTHTHNTQRSNCCCSTRTHTHTPTRNRGPAFPDRDATAASILLFPIVDLSLCFGRHPDRTHTWTDGLYLAYHHLAASAAASRFRASHLIRRHLYIVGTFCRQTWGLEYYFARIPPSRSGTNFDVRTPPPTPTPTPCPYYYMTYPANASNASPAGKPLV